MTQRNGSFWLKLFAGIVIVGMAALAASLTVFYDDVQERRVAFCEAENRQARKTRLLWEGVIVQAQANPVVGFVEIEGKRYDVYRPKVNDVQLAAFRKLVADVYPLREC